MEIGKEYKLTEKRGSLQPLIIPTEKVVIKRKIYNDLAKEHLFERTFNGKRYFVSCIGLKYVFLPCDQLSGEDDVEVYKGQEVRTFKIKKFKKNPTLPMYKAVLELNGQEFLTQSFSCKPDVKDKISFLCQRVKTNKTRNMILFSTSL